MHDMQNMISVAIKTAALILLAPLVSGVIRKIKNTVRMRKGAGVLQSYYDVLKLFSKDEVVSRNASWIFYAAPVISFAVSIMAAVLIFAAWPDRSSSGNAMLLLTVFFVMALGRFFTALAGLDTASSFGGMGSSREMFISSFVEPTAFVAVFVLFMKSSDAIGISKILAGIAMFVVAIAETSRIPVDNRETHLELTMVHEAMVLEYSGRSLALIELSGHIRQMIFFTMLSWYLFPPNVPFVASIAAIAAIVACIEVSIAKMRLFRVSDLLSFAFFMSAVASIAAALGV